MPPNPLEANALQEISELVKHPLYQQECPPDSFAGKSKACANHALLQAICASNHEDCRRRRSLWEAATISLFSAGIEALREVHRHRSEAQEVNEAAWAWRQLEGLLYQAQTTAASVYTYWQGWNEALGNATAEPESALPEPATDI